MAYDHISLEQKWQKFWNENQVFRTLNPLEKGGSRSETEAGGLAVTENQSSVSTSSSQLLSQGALRPKKYILDMFPYPSGAGLHVGHPKGYTATDIVSRYYHAKGYTVLHPMGWDAFGLPAENYAIKTGTHPKITTEQNIATFKGQMQALGFSYDWDRAVDTTDPEYYKWTQWVFLQLFERGLAYEQNLPINYCPSCKTGLANEEVLSDNTCDRCGTKVERRPIRQWVLRITEYADRLIEDLDGLDWPEGIKEMQRNWIGKSEGCEFRMMKQVERKPTALILHGWDDEENRTDWHWMSPLKIELEKIGYDVIMEQLPGNNAPDLEKQLAFLEQYIDRLDERSVIIGHSMGGFLGMHFVERLGKKIDKLICVAPIFAGLIDHVDWSGETTGWDIGSASMRKSYNPDLIQKNVSDWQVFLSENDKWIDHTLAKKHFETVGANITSVPNAGHFSKSDGYATFPALLEEFDHIRVYTTRVDTVYGMTYAVLAPDHPKVEDFITPEKREICEKYIEGVKGKSDLDRTNDGKEKTGVFTGSYVVNPYNGESVPLWIADFVLGHYGTGALMAVPAHDERDGEFARKYNLPIQPSIAEKIGETLKDYTPRIGVGALIMNELGEILLQSQTHPRGEMYSLPGGGVEEGEDYREALAREIREETGYTDFEIEECIGAFEYNYYSPERGIDRKLTELTYKVVLKSEKKEALQLTGRELNLDLKNIWTSQDEVFKKLLQTKDFCGYPEERILRRYFENKAFCDEGVLVNSGEYDGLTSTEARRVLSEKAEKEGFGNKKINYKLRDWLFSRQRYWGEPIPLIHISSADYEKLPKIQDISEATDPHIAYIFDKKGTEKLCKNCTCGDVGCEKLIIGGKAFSKVYDGIEGEKIVCDYSLPLLLPEVEKYEPAGDGQSPLATVPSFVNIELASNLKGKRETNTMPQWGGSCWYYLRYMDSKNKEALAGKEALEYWQNVDEYVGGAEHAVLHLLYARFWHKVLYDIGVVPTLEPFQKLTNVGMILAYAYERDDGGLVAVDLVEERDGKYFEKETGKEVKQVVAKMSKSLKNVVNPNDIVREYGADTLRLYEMSMSGFTDTAPWNPEAIIGVRRFLDRVYATYTEGKNIAKDDMKAMKLLHKTVKKVGEDIVEYKFNTAISALMILLNEGIPTDPEFAQEWKEKFAILLHPFAPHMAEELYQLGVKSYQLGVSETDNTQPTTISSIYHAPWPDYDDFMLVDDEVTIAVQVNGKLRGTLTCLNGVAQEEVSALAHDDLNIAKWMEGKTLVKEIFIPNKMLSIVVKD